jgi:hypothetical protein
MVKKTNLLIWKGGDPFPGWPASDHEEPDPEVYQAKLASRLYRTPDSKEDESLLEQQRARKAQVNAQAAKDAQYAAERAQAAADAAQKEADERRARARAQMAAAQRTMKEAEEAQKETAEGVDRAFASHLAAAQEGRKEHGKS